MKLRVLSFKRASEAEVASGLGGWLRVTLDEILIVDGITVRVTEGGKLTLSFPARTDRNGLKHPYIRPMDDEVRRSIEAAVFKQLPELVKAVQP